MVDVNIENTPENHYKNALDSVNLINDLLSSGTVSDDDKHSIWRNVEHLKTIVSKPEFQSMDLAPLNAAISAGSAVGVNPE